MSTRSDLSRRTFLRRAFAGSVGILALEGVGGTLALLWPNLSEGLGARLRIGSLADIMVADPAFADGYPHPVAVAQSFLVNAPAAMALASGQPPPTASPRAGDLIALWRRCPHLGCVVPPLCEDRKRFQCRCHGSTYTILGEKLEKGPAERGMDRFAVSIDEDGQVVVDTREIIAGAPEGQLSFRDPHPPDVGCGAR